MTRKYTGDLGMDHKRIPDNDPNKEAKKYERAHEKRRLKAYLKGDKRFQHGRTPSLHGFSPIMFNVDKA